MGGDSERERVCGWCGTDISRRRAGALFCSASCRREIARLRPLFEGQALDGRYRSVLDRVVRHKRAKARLLGR
jgi:hypothetical protein